MVYIIKQLVYNVFSPSSEVYVVCSIYIISDLVRWPQVPIAAVVEPT